MSISIAFWSSGISSYEYSSGKLIFYQNTFLFWCCFNVEPGFVPCSLSILFKLIDHFKEGWYVSLKRENKTQCQIEVILNLLYYFITRMNHIMIMHGNVMVKSSYETHTGCDRMGSNGLKSLINYVFPCGRLLGATSLLWSR